MLYPAQPAAKWKIKGFEQDEMETEETDRGMAMLRVD